MGIIKESDFVKLLEKIDEFNHTKKYNGVVLSLGFFSWFFSYLYDVHWPSMIFIFIIIVIFMYTMITKIDWIPIVSPGLCLFFCFTGKFWYTVQNNSFWIIIAVPLFFIICLFIHRKNIILGKLWLGYVLLGICSLLSLINAYSGMPAGYYLNAISPIFYIIIYTTFVSFIPKNKADYFGRLLVMLGVMISIQIFAWYAVNGSSMISNSKSLTLGWGISNAIAIILNITIAMNCFFLCRTKSRFIWSITLAIQSIGMLLTMSRGGLLGSIFIAIAFSYIIYKHHKDKKFLAVEFGAFVILIPITIFIFSHSSTSAIRWLWDNGSDDRGRWVVYKEAIETFIKYPLFGGSLAVRTDSYGNLHHFHNTVLHVLACLGLTGFAALIFHLYQKFKLLFENLTLYKTFAIIAIIATHIHGLFDNTYFTSSYMMLLILWLAIIEKDIYPDSIDDNDCNLM